MVIGNPRGKISDTNPNGLSKQQMHTMKSILIYESNKNNYIDSNNNNNIDSINNNNKHRPRRTQGETAILHGHGSF